MVVRNSTEKLDYTSIIDQREIVPTAIWYMQNSKYINQR